MGVFRFSADSAARRRGCHRQNRPRRARAPDAARHELSLKERDGVIVIRPITSWDDPENPLNLTVPAFLQPDATVINAIARLLDVPPPPGRAPSDDAFDFVFEGGTRAEALNALIRARAGLGWDIGFILHQPVPNPTFTVRVYKDALGWIDIGTPLVRLVPQH
jgi:hypothetical protein